MAFQDLRDFIALLERKGQLKHIKAPVNCELEITEITDRATAKLPEEGHPRPWPPDIVMKPEIVDMVTKRWKEYGIKL